MLLEIRRPDIVFPLSFDTEKAPKQVRMQDISSLAYFLFLIYVEGSY